LSVPALGTILMMATPHRKITLPKELYGGLFYFFTARRRGKLYQQMEKPAVTEYIDVTLVLIRYSLIAKH
jgi:hypothetical protein